MTDDVTPLSAEEIEGERDEIVGLAALEYGRRLLATIDALQARLTAAEAVVEAARDRVRKGIGNPRDGGRLYDALTAYDATTKETSRE